MSSYVSEFLIRTSSDKELYYGLSKTASVSGLDVHVGHFVLWDANNDYSSRLADVDGSKKTQYSVKKAGNKGLKLGFSRLMYVSLTRASNVSKRDWNCHGSSIF